MRKTQVVRIEEENRDKGKVFLLREMPAAQGEKYAVKVFLAMAKSGVEVPDNFRDMGFAGLVLMGLESLRGVKFYEDVEPLLDEMMACVTIIPDAVVHPEVQRALIDDDVEEITTLAKLRKELIHLHTGFTWPDGASTSGPSEEQVPRSMLNT